MLRGFKRKQKQAIVFRSKANVESLCLILSIINTAKLNNINPYFKILEIFNRNTSIPNLDFLFTVNSNFTSAYFFYIINIPLHRVFFRFSSDF